jgi:hypothetical protein
MHVKRVQVWLKENPNDGKGKLFLDFKLNFSTNNHRKGALAWDACASGDSAVYDNGHPVEGASGSTVFSVEIVDSSPAASRLTPTAGVALRLVSNPNGGGRATLRVGNPCDLTYTYPDSGLQLSSPLTSASGVVKLSSLGNGVDSINYIELTAPPSNNSHFGVTEDADGCRGVCEVVGAQFSSRFTAVVANLRSVCAEPPPDREGVLLVHRSLFFFFFYVYWEGKVIK